MSAELKIDDVAWTRVRIDTAPDKDGWCLCTPANHPEDIARGLAEGEWNESDQFLGQVAASPASQEVTDQMEEAAWVAFENADDDRMRAALLAALKAQPAESRDEVIEAIEMLEFNAKHLIAEDDKDDALATLEVARTVMREVARSLKSKQPEVK